MGSRVTRDAVKGRSSLDVLGVHPHFTGYASPCLFILLTKVTEFMVVLLLHPFYWQVDCFSFGMFIYELLTLHQPFEGHESVKECILEGGRPPLTYRVSALVNEQINTLLFYSAENITTENMHLQKFLINRRKEIMLITVIYFINV